MDVVKTIREYLDKTENSEKHLEKYITNIKKVVGDKQCIIGHVHKYIKKDNVEIVDTFMKGVHYIINDKYLVISDTHITNESTKEYLDGLMKILYFYDNKKVVLLGDIFDFWVSNGEDMKENKNIQEIINFINNNDVVYIIGNHDFEVEKYFDVKTVDKFEDDTVVFYHGHQFDDFFNSTFIGKFFLYIQLRFGDNIYKFNKWLKAKFYTEK